jgi:hypothetical protein
VSSASSNRSRILLCGGLALLAAAVLILAFSLSGSASSAKVSGAAALPDQPAPQESSSGLQPSPEQARADRGPIVSDGCMVGKTGTESDPTCVYGDKHGNWTVYLFGDSHAMQYFTPLEKLAKENHWRLVVLNKRECSPADVHVARAATGREYRTCDVWHNGSLRVLEGSADHATVVLSGDKAARASIHGHPLSGATNATAMERGYVATLKRLRRAGLGVVVIKDLPSSPKGIPHCVSQNLHHLKACAFPHVRDAAVEFDARAARAVPGVHLIDLTPEVCPHGLCRAVIGNALVYRDKHHLTATYARTLSPWIAQGLRAAGAPFSGR